MFERTLSRKMLRMFFWIFLYLYLAMTIEGCRNCPVGIKKVKCLVPPCKGTSCKDATCKNNYCGGCSRLWYSKNDGLDVTKRCEFKCPGSIDCLPGVNVVNCLISPCDPRFAKCPKFPTATCCSVYCGGCHAVWFVDGNKVQC